MPVYKQFMNSGYNCYKNTIIFSLTVRASERQRRGALCSRGLSLARLLSPCSVYVIHN